MSIRHLAVLPNGDAYISAAHGDEEPFIAKVLNISNEGKVEWELNIPDHVELTAIAATDNAYSLSGHKINRFNGSDASIFKTSLNG